MTFQSQRQLAKNRKKRAEAEKHLEAISKRLMGIDCETGLKQEVNKAGWKYQKAGANPAYAATTGWDPPWSTLIFDRFKTSKKAEAFAAIVMKTKGRDYRIYDNPEEAEEAAVFPFVLTAPVVLVERHTVEGGIWTDEEQGTLEKMAKKFGGTFVGT